MIQNEIYEIAEHIRDHIKDKDIISWEEFDKLYREATLELFKVDIDKDGVVKEDSLDYIVNINGKEFDTQELETDIRGVLGYSGWATIYEGEHAGGLTTKELN